MTDSTKIILGSRLSWYEDKNGTAEENAVYTPYAGIIHDINDQLSAYISYSDIFTPQSRLDSSGNRLDPIVGSNYDVGLKGEFLDGALNASIALFRLEQTNLAEVDETIPNDSNNICGGRCYKPSEEIISQGVDIHVSGATTFGLQLNGSYTYQDSEYAEGNRKGDGFNTDHPEHILNLSGTYNLPGDKWTLGAQVRFQSKQYIEGINDGAAYRVEESSVSLLDLILQYRIDDSSTIKLKIANLFDENYFESVSFPRGNNHYGTPRSFLLNYRLSF